MLYRLSYPGSTYTNWRWLRQTTEQEKLRKKMASSGNRTRAARVAGEHSTTEPTMLSYRLKCSEPSHKVFIFWHYWRLDNGQSSPLLMPNLFVQKYMARPLIVLSIKILPAHWPEDRDDWLWVGSLHFNLLESIVGSVVECSPATRAARVRFPDDAINFVNFPQTNIKGQNT